MKDVALLVLGSLLTIAGGWLADMRAYRQSDFASKRDRGEKLREQQRQAIADVISSSLPYRQTAGSVNILLLANVHQNSADLANRPELAAHAPNYQALSRAMSLAKMILVDCPRTQKALTTIDGILDAWTTARGEALEGAGQERPLREELAGPLMRAEDSLEGALDELITVAREELVASYLYV